MARRGTLLVIGIVAAVLVAATVVYLAAGAPEQAGAGVGPIEARDSVAALVSGDPDAVRTALSPALVAAVPAGTPVGEPGIDDTEVTIVDWSEQDGFAMATAVLRRAEVEVEMAVGFRLVGNQWKIIFAMPGRPS